MAERRDIAIASTRIVTGLIGLAVGVVAVGAAIALPWPSVTALPSAVTISPTASEQQRVCAGPLLSLADDATQATAAASFGSASVVSAAGDSEVTSVDLDAPRNPRFDRDGGPTLLSAPPVDDGGALAGSQSQVASTETVAGFAAAACAEALDEAWLVAGATDVGRTSLIVLSNPTSVAATVSLELFGENGPIDAPGTSAILVPAGQQVVLPLAGFAPNVRTPVVHVISEGGRVAANLQHTVIRGLTPGGVELAGPSALPAETVVIPGVVLSANTADTGEDHTHDLEDSHPVIRLLAPDADAQATIDITAESNGAVTSLKIDLTAGQSIDVPLDGLSTGGHTITVRSSEPIVAAARTAVTLQNAPDFSWHAASEPLLDDAPFVVAEGPSPVLHLTNPGSTDVTVEVVPGEGAARSVVVPANGAASVSVSAEQSYTLEGVAGLHASVGYLSPATSSSFALQPPGPLEAPVRVYTH